MPSRDALPSHDQASREWVTCASCRGRHVPVIFLSAQTTPGAHEEAALNGADKYLMKPVSRTELLAIVKEFCERGERENAKQRERQREEEGKHRNI